MRKIRKSIPVWVLFLGFTVIKLDAAAQSSPWIAPKRSNTARVTTPPTGSAVTPQENIDSKEVKESVTEALAVIKKHHISGENLNYADVFKSSITATLRTLDPYSTYYDAKEFAELTTNPPSAGVGLKIQDHRLEGERGIFIHDAFQGSPAAKSGGLKFGDKIIKVDDWDAKGRSLAEVNKELQGPRGSRVNITIERGVDREIRTIEVTRELFPQPPVPHAYMLGARVGYIDLGNGFKLDSGAAFANKLQELHNKGMTALVLDLRDNPGGLLIEGVKVANQFLGKGQLILRRSTRKTNSAALEFRSINSNPHKVPVVVLVNEGTGPGAEIVSGALQDHKRALIVGETTFGLGLIQSFIGLEYGSVLKLTNSRIVLPSGRLMQGDYSNLSFYYKGPPQRIEQIVSAPGGGIEPDEVVRQVKLNRERRQMIDPVFGFACQLVNGHITGFNSFQVRHPVDFSHDLKPDEFAVTDSLFKAFKEFVAKEPVYKLNEKQLDTNREFIARQLRYYIVSAFYGSVTAERVLKADDPQILKAVEALPRAARLVAP